MSFKVGDKVKIIKRKEGNRTGLKEYNLPNGDVGKIGKVTDVNSDDNCAVRDMGEDVYLGWFKEGEEIELVEEKFKFKVGDRVIMLNAESERDGLSFNPSMNKSVGTTGTVTSIGKSSNGKAYFTVDGDWNWRSEWLAFPPEEKEVTQGKTTTMRITPAMDMLLDGSSGILPRRFPSLEDLVKQYKSLQFNAVAEGTGVMKIHYSTGAGFKPEPKKKGFMYSIIDKVKNLALDAATRTLRSHGFEDENGKMTMQAIDFTSEEMIKERWAARREAVAADLAKIEAEEKK